jgi:A/G-specific adenine glycosylase
VTPPENLAVFRHSLVRWYRRNGRDLPWRRTRDPYAILVSEFMLQQTQVATVIPYYDKWLCRFPDFASLARASENEVLRAWQGLGYYARARNLHATAKTVMNRHDGKFPRRVEQMRQLSGIGKYTAHAVASFAFDEPVPIVEANTGRVLARLFDLRESIDSNRGRRLLWQHAASVLPKNRCRDFQLCTPRFWRAHLHSPKAEVRCVRSQKFLPRKTSGCTPNKEVATGNQTTHRDACINH